MTQPVQEETPERAVGALDFRTRQLARRPGNVRATGGFAWVRIGQYSRTVADSTIVPLASRFLEYDPALVAEDVDFSWDQEDVGETNNSWVVRSRIQGWYLWDALLNIHIETFTNDAGTIDLWLSEDVTDDDLGEYMESWDIFDDNTFTSGSSGEGHQYVHAAGLLHVTSTNRTWHWKVAQSTGQSIEIGVEHITVMRLSADDSDDWITLTSDPS